MLESLDLIELVPGDNQLGLAISLSERTSPLLDLGLSPSGLERLDVDSDAKYFNVDERGVKLDSLGRRLNVLEHSRDSLSEVSRELYVERDATKVSILVQQIPAAWSQKQTHVVGLEPDKVGSEHTLDELLSHWGTDGGAGQIQLMIGVRSNE